MEVLGYQVRKNPGTPEREIEKPWQYNLVSKLPDKVRYKMETGFLGADYTKGFTRTPEVLTDKEVAKIKSSKLPSDKILTVLIERNPNAVQLGDDFAILKPFKGIMKASLRRIGEVPSDKIQVLAEQYYNKVVRRKRMNGEAPATNKEVPDLSLAKVYRDDLDSVKNAIIDGVTSFITTAKQKADAGDDLTEVERIAADGAVVVQTKLEEKARQEASQQVGESLLFDRGLQLKILAVIVVVIVTSVIIGKSV